MYYSLPSYFLPLLILLKKHVQLHVKVLAVKSMMQVQKHIV